MPSKPRRPCATPGCVNVVTSGHCPQHKRPAARAGRHAARRYDRTRGSASARGYGRQWRHVRDAFLRRHPLCVDCQRRGITRPATEVDHIQPHRGDALVFWQADNLQALCKGCHSRKTAAEVNGRA